MANPFVTVSGFFGRFFGNTIGESAAYGIGGALTEPIKPLLQELSNQTWATATAAGVGKPLDVFGAAEVVAEDVQLHPWGVAQAGESGSTAGIFDAVLGATLNAPGIPQLFEAWRRGLIDDPTFTHGLRKAKLETRWDGPLKGLKQRLLSPGDLANARQQGFITATEQRDEADLQGIDNARADIQFELAGLPPGVETALEMLRRNIIDPAEFAEIVRTGHTKTKWTTQLLAMQARVLNAATYAGLFLRGWITRAQMDAGGALTGYDPAQMDLLYKEHGRPATGHQIFIGLRRGGTYNGPTTGIPQTFIDGIRQSNIRPEWTNLLWAGRYTYPSPFVLRSLTEAGDLTQVETEQILLYEGWEPALAATVSTKWAGGTGATVDPHVSKAQTQLWSTTHSSFVAGEADVPAATTALTAAGVLPAAIPGVLALWQEEVVLRRKQLTAAQVKKAYSEGITNQDTGATYTRADAVAALLARGYSTAQANEFLDL